MFSLQTTILQNSCLHVTPEERAKAVVAYFPAIPERIRREVEAVVARAIRRAIAQEVAVLEIEAEKEAIRADGRGKQARGQDISALRTHRWWEARLKSLRLAMGRAHAQGAPTGDQRLATVEQSQPLKRAVVEKPCLVRTRRLKVGDLVTVHPCAGAYTELPEGLVAETKVTVVSTDIGTAVVADAAGRQFTVFFNNIEMPCDVWWKGKWIDRFRDPEGEEAYQKVVFGN